MSRHLCISFWDICLGNLPEGDFTHQRMAAADARLRIEDARKRNALLCLSDDDLLAPYRKDALDNHRSLCRVLKNHYGIDLSIKDFCARDGDDRDPLYFANPLNCMQLTHSSELMIISCAYIFSGKIAGGKPAHDIDPATVAFHLLALMEPEASTMAGGIEAIAAGLGATIIGKVPETRGGAFEAARLAHSVEALSHAAHPESGWLGAMRDCADELDEIVEDAMRRRQVQAWRPDAKDFQALEAMSEATGQPLATLLNEALRLLLQQRSSQSPAGA